MRVLWLRQARTNLEQEADYIAKHDPAAADRMINTVLDRANRLAAVPALGRPGRVPGTRELVVPGTPYILPYRVRRDTVEILRLFHGARRWPEDMDED